MIQRVRAALRRIQEELAQVLDAGQITAICRDVGYQFRQRLLDPVATIHLFVIQIFNGNFAVARLKDFTDAEFSEAAYCKARGRLPLQVLQTLLQRVGAALRSTQDAAEHGGGTAPFMWTVPLSACRTRRNCRRNSANPATSERVAASQWPTCWLCSMPARASW